MQPEEVVPKRSNFWFSKEQREDNSTKILDKITVIFAFCLCLFAFIIFWPIVSKISFEEAFFTPLAPFLLSSLGYFNVEVNQAMQILFITSFVVSALGVYLLVRDLTKRQLPAILSAVIYLIPPIPIFVLTFLRIGLLETELASAKSFFSVVYGDGASFIALALIPFAMLFFLRYLKKGSAGDLVTTIVFSSLILLANRSQALSLVLVLTVTVLTESLLGLARVKLKRYLTVLIISAGIVSFWYTPNFWLQGLVLFANQAAKNIKSLFPLPFILAVFSLLFAFVFFARKERRQGIVITFLIFVVFSGILFDWFVNSHALVPHPQRLFSNVNMFGSMLLSLAIMAIIDRTHIAEVLRVEQWSSYARALTAIIFGFISFSILSLIAYFLSPLAILAVAGPNGIWTKVRIGVIADRLETLNVAGGNFMLVPQSVENWQLWLGYGVSLIFLLMLVYLIIKSSFFSSDNSDE